LPHRLIPLVLAALLVALVPLATVAAGPTFSDLNSAGEVHRADIQAIGDAGITTGFPDPNNASTRLYNPTGTVTREQMASFLARTAGLGSNPPVANAQTAQTAINAQNAANAQNANTVGGIAPSGFVRLAQGVSVGAPVPPSVPPAGMVFNTLRSATIIAPSNGFILAIGTVSMSSGACGSPCSVLVRVRSTGTTGSAISSTVTSAQSEALANTAIIQVNAGTQTIVFEAGSAPAGAAADNPNLSVFFVPFGFDGGTTLAP
jgi:hypothetical protein